MNLLPDTFPLIVYMVDDNPIDIFIVQQMLEYSCPNALLVSFSTARQAIEELNKEKAEDSTHAQVLLLDLDMPMLDGWEFLEKYEKSAFYQRKPAPVYIFTASINPKDVAKSKSYTSVEGFFSKPLKEEHLLELQKHISTQLDSD